MKKVLIINNSPKAGDMQYYYNEYHKQLMSIPLKVISEIEKIGGCETRLVFHAECIEKSIEDYKADYIIACGRYSDWQYGYHNMDREFANEYRFFAETTVPTIGICAGLQVCALAYGGNIGKMGSNDEVFIESGFKRVTFHEDDPLFANIDNGSEFMMLHRDEVNEVPEEFKVLASSEMCKVQIIKHKTKQIYGLQFHPELYTEMYPAGRQILKNFLNL